MIRAEVRVTLIQAVLVSDRLSSASAIAVENLFCGGEGSNVRLDGSLRLVSRCRSYERRVSIFADGFVHVRLTVDILRNVEAA